MLHPMFCLIITNWNGLKHLPECLNSLEDQTFRDYEVVLIDNGSTDGSVEYVEANFPNVKIIKNSSNLGFCKAANQGIQHSQSEFTVLLNNDTRCDPAFLASLMQCWQTASANVLAIFPKALYYDRPDIINSAGVDWTRWGFWQPVTDGLPNLSISKECRYVFGDRFIAPCFRTELIISIGAFDEEFVTYHEDFDVSYRANLMGYKFMVCPSAVIFHKMSQALKDNNVHASFKLRLGLRNFAFVLLKNYSLPHLLVYGPWFFLRVYVYNGIVRSLKRWGWGNVWRVLAAVAGASFDVILHLPYVVRKRRVIQSQRVVGDGDIWHMQSSLDRKPVHR